MINKNAKCWKELMSKQEFMDWCFNTGGQNILYALSNVPGYQLPLVIYDDNNGIINLIDYFRDTLNNNHGIDMMTRLLSLIYDLYADSIPYNQQSITVNQISITNTKYSANILQDLCRNISAYINIFSPDILQWYFVSNKYLRASNIVNAGNTRAVQRSNNIDMTNQNESVSKQSFNPVNKNTNITVSPVKVNTQENGGLGNNTYQDVTSANWNTNSSGTSGNTSIDEQISEQDITQLRELGTENMLKYLKPLIYKIGTLFWMLGNDNIDGASWGINVW